MGKTSGDRSAIGSPAPDDIDVADVIPFLVIGAISAARRILAIGAKLSWVKLNSLCRQADRLPLAGAGIDSMKR